MNVLIVGGAGYVGSILRPALEAEHACRYLDLRAAPGCEDRTTIGDVNDPAAVAEAVRGQEAVVYLAMGGAKGPHGTVNDIAPAFTVNVQGLYTVLSEALQAGVRRVVYASSLSVYRPRRMEAAVRERPLDESIPPNTWTPYGLTKRLGEAVCAAAAQEYPEATLVALRLIRPQNDEDWSAKASGPVAADRSLWLGPEDTRRLFLAALALSRPGCHVVQASGDMEGRRLPNHAARALLGWSPENR